MFTPDPIRPLATRNRCGILAFLIMLLLVAARVSTAAAAEPKRTPLISQPRIPQSLHNLLQSREYERSIDAINQLISKDLTAEVKEYLLYLKGTAYHALDRQNEALAAFSEVEKQFPKGNWVSRARFGSALVYSRNRNYQKAAEIYQKETERLLSSGRRDELTEIYLEFADRYFTGEHIVEPGVPKTPDYAQALVYYQQALTMRPGSKVQQKTSLRIARCQLETNQVPLAITAYQGFISAFASPTTVEAVRASDEMQVEARYQLGRAQLLGGQAIEARKTWEDLIESELARKGNGTLIADASYRLAQTFGSPAPTSVGNMELAVARLERFLKAFPDHALAAQAEFDIAACYSAQQRHEQAVARLKSLIENPAYSKAQQVASAWNQLGLAYAAQKKFTSAIDAWRTFLNLFPSDANWSQVQRMIIDIEYSMAEDEERQEHFELARQQWETFLNKYPLDPRAAAILLNFGVMNYRQGVRLQNPPPPERADLPVIEANPEKAAEYFNAAILDWRKVVSKYPGTAESSSASLQIARILEERLLRLQDALEAYRKVEGQFQEEAKKRIAQLTGKRLEVITERKFRSNQKPHIRLATRNLESVTVKVYRVDLADYFRKMHLTTGVESLDIALIDPDKTWEVAINHYEKYRRLEQEVEIPVDGPGVTAVTVSSDTMEATTMVVVSDLDVVLKSSRNELFAFVQNMLEGKPAAGVKVLVSDGSKVITELETDKNGIIQKSLDELKSINDLRLFVINEGHTASSHLSLDGLDFAVGLTPKGYLSSDRPAYRGGQLVHLKGIIRWVDQDRFVFKTGEKFQLDVYDARARVIHSQAVTLNDFGSFIARFTLPTSSPQGVCRVHVHQPGRPATYETTFVVHDYQLEPVQFLLDVPERVVYRGEKVKGKISLRYHYGSPLAGKEVHYQLADERQHKALTNEKGEIEIELDTQKFSEAQQIPLVALFPERNLQSVVPIFVATRGFEIAASTNRGVYLTGEPFDVSIAVQTPAGKGIEVPLKLQVFEQLPAARGLPASERLVSTSELKTDAQGGKGIGHIAIEQAGRYLVRASGTDRFGNEISGQVAVQISGQSDQVRLRVFADNHSYRVGDTGKVQVHWRDKSTLALLTFEGASILGYRLVTLETGTNEIEIPFEEKLAPNFHLAVTVMESGKFHEARTDFQVARKLRIRLVPSSKTVRPGEPFSVDLEVTDAAGKPVSTEINLRIVQKNLIQLIGRQGVAIDQFFGSDQRQIALRTTTSCAFRYQPPTRPINLFVLNEAEREKILAEEAKAHMVAEQVLAQSWDRGQNQYSDVDLNGLYLNQAGDSAIVFETLSAGVDQNNDFVEAFGVQLGGNGTNFMPMGNTPNSSGGSGFAFSQSGQGQNRAFWGFGRGRQQQQLQNGRRPAIGLQSGMGVMNESLPAGSTTRHRFITNGEPANHGVTLQIPALQLNNNEWMALGDTNKAYVNTFGGNNAYFLNGGLNQLRRHNRLDVKMSATNKFLGDLAGNATPLWAVNPNGEFQVVNGMDVGRLATLARDGMEIVATPPSAETAYWNPSILTDEKGTARVSLQMPDLSTAWVVQAQGISKDSQAGEEETEIITRKELFAEVRLPLALTVGDRTEVPVEVHHVEGVKEPVEVRFRWTIGGKTTELKQMVPPKGPGVTELVFPLETTAGESVELQVSLQSGQLKDQVERSVPILDYGTPLFATASGSSAQNTSFAIAFPSGTVAFRPQLEILIGPSIHRGLLDAVLGSTAALFERRLAQPATSLERAVSDVIGGVAVLKLIGASRTSNSPEAQTLSGKIQSSLAQLISDQRDDGGWSWTGSSSVERADRYLSSRAVWALAAARKGGFAVPNATYDKGVQYLQSAFASADEADAEGKAILLHGLAEAGVADFAHANRLYRSRQQLSASGLVHLALTLQRLDKTEFATDILTIAKTRIVARPANNKSDTGDPILKGCLPWMQSTTELRALFLLALSQGEPAAPQNAELADWLIAARIGTRWLPEKANGPAIAALADWFGRGKLTAEKYTLSIHVNDRLVEKLTIDPSIEPTRVVAVPAKSLVDDRPQRVQIDMEGRGTFSYSAVLTGFAPADKVRGTTQEFAFSRSYSPAPRMLDGLPIPRGFQNLTGQVKTFNNPLTQLPQGERGDVSIRIWRREVRGVANEQFDYLVHTEPIPAGAVVVPESIQGAFERYEIIPGAIVFYLGDRPHPGTIHFSVAGLFPGSYRNAPSVLRSFYQPERIAVAKDLPLEVLPNGVASKDEYRLTPTELLEFGRRYLAKRDFDKAAEYLQPLFKDYRLTDDKQMELVKMLFEVALERNDHAGIVQHFEIIKERFPDQEIGFEQILKVAQSYIQLGEYERGYLVYRATAEASFLRENQIAGFLDRNGEFLKSVQIVEQLLRDYPAEGYVATATYALAQEIQGKAPEAGQSPKLRAAGVTRVDLLSSAIHILDHFLSNWPNDPAADQVAFAIANALLELEQYKVAVERCTRFGTMFPDSKLVDSFWYVIGFSQFSEGHHEEALATCRKVADYTRIDPTSGVAIASTNRDPAIYIMGQIFHSLGQPANAIQEYERVRNQFPDARESIDFFMRKGIALPEVTSVKPGDVAKAKLVYRNVNSVSVKVYRIDLLKFGLLQRNLAKITAINLAGIRPYHEQQIALGDGRDYRDVEKELEMPLKEEGAYLVVAQGENLYTSGLVLVSPLVLEIQEDATAGRVRVTVKDAVADRYMHNIHVKVIGSQNDQFVSGQTDLRGLFIADAINGTSTVIAKTDANRYAFFRGKQFLGTPPASPQPARADAPTEGKPSDNGKEQLLKNLNDSNSVWQKEQRLNYRNMLDNRDGGVKVKKAY